MRENTTSSAPPLAATILAAGQGRRLGGRPKATLQVGGVSVLERLVNALRAAGVQTVSVVIGPYRDQLLPLVEHCGAHAVAHAQPCPSLIDSQRLALQAHRTHRADHDLLLVLGDLPLLDVADIAPLIDAWHRRAPTVHAQMPVVDGVRGHPLLLSSHAVQQVCAQPGPLGVRAWLSRHPGIIEPIPTARRAHVTDLDTRRTMWPPCRPSCIPCRWPGRQPERLSEER